MSSAECCRTWMPELRHNRIPFGLRGGAVEISFPGSQNFAFDSNWYLGAEITGCFNHYGFNLDDRIVFASKRHLNSHGVMKRKANVISSLG